MLNYNGFLSTVVIQFCMRLFIIFIITKQPIYGQIKNEKLTGNYKMFVNNKSISTTKPINYTIPDNAYWFGNSILNSRVWIYGTAVKEIKNDFISKIDKNQKAIKLNLANIIWNIEFINCKMEHIILER